MNTTMTQSFGYQTKQYLETAHEEANPLKTHLAGRACLLGTAVVGTVEIVARLAFFILGHIGGIFTLYQANGIKEFLQEQVNGGFSASVITSASLFSLLSPNLFRTLSFPQEGIAPPRRREINQERIEEMRVASLVNEVVRLPFEMVGLAFQLPFYLTYLTFQIAFVLPIRMMLLPLQICTSALDFGAHRRPFRLGLI